MQYTLCRHIKTNGTRCKAPSLTEGVWCYFHSRLHQRHTAFRHTELTRGYLIPGQHIELTALEDRESVQVALSVVINALATGRLDANRATALLYGLQLASNNARGLYTEPYASSVVRDVEPSPEGLDLAQLNSQNLKQKNLKQKNEKTEEPMHQPIDGVVSLDGMASPLRHTSPIRRNHRSRNRHASSNCLPPHRKILAHTV